MNGDMFPPDAILPAGYSLMVAFKTYDLDHGDPENGPSPDVQTIAMMWTLYDDRTNVALVRAKYDVNTKHEHGHSGWYALATNGFEITDNLQEKIAAALDESTRRYVMSYLHESGLI